MKNTLSLLLSAGILVCGAHAELEPWTNRAGKTVRMELVEVVRDGDKVIGKFKIEDGRTFDVNADDLDEAGATRLREWQPKPEGRSVSDDLDEAGAARLREQQPKPEIKSVFDELLEGRLVRLRGRRMRAFDFSEKPEKVYIFYYTASWCPPCRAYTPGLVEFYERMKQSHGTLFELILITSDRNEEAMTGYARDAKMPWPQVRFSQARDVRDKLGHAVRGIPTVIVTDLDGKVLSRNRNLATIESILTRLSHP